MEILRAKTLDLRQTGELTLQRQLNSEINRQEALEQKTILASMPRRLVFELTNRCNLNCIMCGRNAAKFAPTEFQIEWLEIFEPIIEKIEEVTLMGWGEPTVHPHFVEFLRWADQYGLRKYFCTNGMRLDELFDDIFQYKVDIIAVSLDGASPEVNSAIRRGADFKRIIASIQAISHYKTQNNLIYPYTNFVLTAMRKNVDQLPAMVRLAAECGMDELKVVFLTAFDKCFEKEVLLDEIALVKEIFAETEKEADRLNIGLKLPYLPGEDPAGQLPHKACYAGWRDFFLGSDGYIRPCMSTAEKMFHISDYQDFQTMWNGGEYQAHRQRVNRAEMNESCRNCYQSSFANWNRRESFIQKNKQFSPNWGKEK